MSTVSKLMIRSEYGNVRSVCSSLFLNFLVHYPIGPKRFQQHLQFIVNNLSFDYQAGREAIMNLLHQIFEKFPREVVNDKAEYFFIPLVLRMVNDEATECRKMAGELIKVLMKNVDPNTLDSLISLAVKWYSSTQN